MADETKDGPWYAGAIGKYPEDDSLVYRDDAVHGVHFYAGAPSAAEEAASILNKLESDLAAAREKARTAEEKLADAESVRKLELEHVSMARDEEAQARIAELEERCEGMIADIEAIHSDLGCEGEWSNLHDLFDCVRDMANTDRSYRHSADRTMAKLYEQLAARDAEVERMRARVGALEAGLRHARDLVKQTSLKEWTEVIDAGLASPPTPTQDAQPSGTKFTAVVPGTPGVYRPEFTPTQDRSGREEAKQRFRCLECGFCVKADEDGLCATCGRDCEVWTLTCESEDSCRCSKYGSLEEKCSVHDCFVCGQPSTEFGDDGGAPHDYRCGEHSRRKPAQPEPAPGDDKTSQQKGNDDGTSKDGVERGDRVQVERVTSGSEDAEVHVSVRHEHPGGSAVPEGNAERIGGVSDRQPGRTGAVHAGEGVLPGLHGGDGPREVGWLHCFRRDKGCRKSFGGQCGCECGPCVNARAAPLLSPPPDAKAAPERVTLYWYGREWGDGTAFCTTYHPADGNRRFDYVRSDLVLKMKEGK